MKRVDEIDTTQPLRLIGIMRHEEALERGAKGNYIQAIKIVRRWLSTDLTRAKGLVDRLVLETHPALARSHQYKEDLDGLITDMAKIDVTVVTGDGDVVIPRTSTAERRESDISGIMLKSKADAFACEVLDLARAMRPGDPAVDILYNVALRFRESLRPVVSSAQIFLKPSKPAP